MSSSAPVVPPDERPVAVELTRVALLRAAPEELVLLEETAHDYYAAPADLLRRDADEAVSAGVDVTLLAPYLLAAANVVLPMLGVFAGEVAKDIVKDVVKEPIAVWLRRLIKRTPDEPTGPVALTPEQADRVRAAVVENCRRHSLPSDHAALIADATVGALHVRR